MHLTYKIREHLEYTVKEGDHLTEVTVNTKDNTLEIKHWHDWSTPPISHVLRITPKTFKDHRASISNYRPKLSDPPLPETPKELEEVMKTIHMMMKDRIVKHQLPCPHCQGEAWIPSDAYSQYILPGMIRCLSCNEVFELFKPVYLNSEHKIIQPD